MRYLILLSLLLSLLLAGCSNKFDECIEQQKAEYRARNPKASVGQVLSRQSDFELMCSKYKPK